jgi:Xaa-Pro aminopeptidase
MLRIPSSQDLFECQKRREKLLELIRKNHPNRDGAILLFGAFESDLARFRQESSFYYLTGIEEPGAALWMELDGPTRLLLPNHGTVRSQWVQSSADSLEQRAKDAGIDSVEVLGEACPGYQLYPFFKGYEYKRLLEYIGNATANNKTIFSLYPQTMHGYVEQRFIVDRLKTLASGLSDSIVDISTLVASLRRVKSMHEREQLQKAIMITEEAHTIIASEIRPGVEESVIQGLLEYTFTVSGSLRPAFPSIVGSGKNSTVLHYTQNERTMQEGDLVVVDIGAEFNYYCADLTRTYPVSGRFTQRQRQIYETVLETQSYIATVARPGYWISNSNEPDKSLHHLARAFLKERGFDQYFPHGIGHFLGMDVHDVGDAAVPLQPGDVITVEPGIYIAGENLGVRIEDNYLMMENGLVCLSDELPRDVESVEVMVQGLANSGDLELELNGKNENFQA